MTETVHGSKSPKPKIGNADIADKLASMGYPELKGDVVIQDDLWQQYLNLTIGTLQNPKNRIESTKNPRIGGFATNEMYDYEGWRVVPIREHVNPEDESSKTLVTGITLKKKQHDTRITAGRAKIMNAQVDAANEAVPGIFYLLKKVSTDTISTETKTPKK